MCPGAKLEMATEGVFLGSLPRRYTMGNVKHSIADTATGPEVLQALAAPSPLPVSENSILGYFTVEVVARYSPIMILRAHELVQARLWCRILGAADTTELENQLVFFRVVDKLLLQVPVSIETVGISRNTGQIVLLEEHVPEKVFASFEHRPPDEPPSIVLRLPPAWASLVASGRWPTFCLACSESTKDNTMFALDWERLRLLQKPPLHPCLDLGDVELSQSSHQDIADKLRTIHASVAGSASRIELQGLERMIAHSQKAADALDLEMAKALYMSAGFGAQSRVSHRRYKSLFILKVLVASMSMRSSPRRIETRQKTDTKQSSSKG